MNQDDIEASRSQFERLDTSKNGFITLDQLKEILQHHNVPPIEVEKMFNDIDQDHSGTIDYSEFIAAAMQKRVYLDEERLHDAFHRLDVEGTGFLTKEGLTKILGASFTADEVSCILFFSVCVFFFFAFLLQICFLHDFFLCHRSWKWFKKQISNTMVKSLLTNFKN